MWWSIGRSLENGEAREFVATSRHKQSRGFVAEKDEDLLVSLPSQKPNTWPSPVKSRDDFVGRSLIPMPSITVYPKQRRRSSNAGRHLMGMRLWHARKGHVRDRRHDDYPLPEARLPHDASCERKSN